MDRTSLLFGPSLSQVGHKRLPLHGRVGLALLVVFWPLNWLAGEGRTYWCYIPLWWGLALSIDSLCLYLRGTSLLSRSRIKYLSLATISIPAWWMFEALNNILARDWYFVGGHLFTDPPLGLLGTIALAGVMPVMFASAELIAGTEIIRRMKRGPVIRMDGRAGLIVSVSGMSLLLLTALAPHYAYAFIWLGIFLLVEAVNCRRGYASLAPFVARGDWRPLISVALGGLVAGIFSELWNWQSSPQWAYGLPWFDWAHIFQLPLLGYVVFLSVGLELHSAYNLILGLLGRREANYIYPIALNSPDRRGNPGSPGR